MASNIVNPKQIIESGTRTDKELEPYCRMLEIEMGKARMLNQILSNPREFKVLSYQELEVEWMSRISQVFPAFDMIYLHIDGKVLNQDLGIAGSFQLLHSALKCVRSSEFVARSQDGSAVIIVAIGRVAPMIETRVVERLNEAGIKVVAARKQCMDADLGLCLKPLIEEVEERLSGRVDRFAAPVAKSGRGVVVRGVSIE